MYMLAFERALMAAAARAARKFTSPVLQSSYGAMAAAIRLPYWDWTQPRVPALLVDNHVMVVDWEGKPLKVDNPFGLYKYTVISMHSLRAAAAAVAEKQQRVTPLVVALPYISAERLPAWWQEDDTLQTRCLLCFSESSSKQAATCFFSLLCIRHEVHFASSKCVQLYTSGGLNFNRRLPAR